MSNDLFVNIACGALEGGIGIQDIGMCIGNRDCQCGLFHRLPENVRRNKVCHVLS
jgi:hypothetical protein